MLICILHLWLPIGKGWQYAVGVGDPLAAWCWNELCCRKEKRPCHSMAVQVLHTESLTLIEVGTESPQIIRLRVNSIPNIFQVFFNAFPPTAQRDNFRRISSLHKERHTCPIILKEKIKCFQIKQLSVDFQPAGLSLVFLQKGNIWCSSV